MGWAVFMLARPCFHRTGSENKVAMAYCQKASDCGLKPILQVTVQVIACAQAKPIPARTMKSARFSGLWEV
jgi:hypothetical protein